MLELLNTYSSQSVPFLFIIDFDKQEPIILPLNQVNNCSILYDFKGFTNHKYGELKKNNNFKFAKYPLTFDEYKRKFDRIQYYLNKGESYLLNLTYETPIETSLTFEEIFEFSKAPYKLLVKDKFVVFSPEPFVQINNNIISSYPMKGTINAAIPNADKIILEDEKELAEHSTMVDLIRNDLSTVATNVSLKNFRYITGIKTFNSELLQVSSEISGEIKPGLMERLGDLFSALLPAGSISGAPKKKTVEIIKEVEGYARGYYTGVFGYFDGLNVESAVMIRYIEQRNSKMYFKSGGGITIYSDVEKEYQELIDKIYVPVNRDN